MNSAIAEYGRVLFARWRWIVWGVVLALAATTCFLLVQSPMYRSDATVFVRTPGDVSRVRDGGDAYAQRRAKTYIVLAGSPSVSSRVIADLGLDIRPETLAGRVTATNPPGTALIDIAVSAPSATEAQRIATVFLSEFTATVSALESVPGSLVPRAELVVVDPPKPPVRVVAWGAPVWIVVLGAALIGLFLGAMGAVMRSVFDNSVRDPRDASRLSGRPLMGSIGGESDRNRTIGDKHIYHRLLKLMGDPTGGVITVTEPERSPATAAAATFLTSVVAGPDPSVVLVDMDVSATESTHLTSDRGLSGVTDVLAGRRTLAEATVDGVHGRFLGVGSATDRAAALIDSTDLRTMIAELRLHYAWVVLACPAATDAAALADVSDIIVMVVRKGATADEQLSQASALIPEAATCAVLFDRGDHPEPTAKFEASSQETKAPR